MHKYPIAIALLLVAAAPAVAAEGFPAYRSYEDTAPADWRGLNERMRTLGGHRGHEQDAPGDNRAPAQVTEAPHVHGDAGSPAPAASAAAPVPRGHGHGHGHMHKHGQQPMRGHTHPQKEKP